MLSGAWTGWEESRRAIEGLGEIAGREVLAESLKKLGRPIAEDMGARCPRDTGATAEDFGVAESRDSKEGGEIAVLVGAHGGKGGRAFIARFIEFGTVNQPARPFMRPAFDSARGGLLGGFVSHLRPVYQRVVRKYAKRARAA